MSSWGDDIKRLSTSNNKPSNLELEVAQNIFVNNTGMLENPHLRVALIASLLFLFLNLQVVNNTINRITKNDTITKVALTAILFMTVYAGSYYNNEY